MPKGTKQPNIDLLEAGHNIPELINMMEYGDDHVRYDAQLALERIGDPIAVERLISLLKKTNPYVRTSAISVLGKLGGARVIKALLEMLADKDLMCV